MTLIYWLTAHPLTTPALVFAFMVGILFGAYLQFRQEDHHGKQK